MKANRCPTGRGDAFIDPGDAIGHRIMAEAGAIPEEIRLKTRARRGAKGWSEATDPVEKTARMKEIADLEMKHAIAREARMKFLGR